MLFYPGHPEICLQVTQGTLHNLCCIRLHQIASCHFTFYILCSILATLRHACRPHKVPSVTIIIKSLSSSRCAVHSTLIQNQVVIWHVMCCAMLCYAMLCYAMLCYAMLCYAMLCSITSLCNSCCISHTKLFCATLHSVHLCSLVSPHQASCRTGSHIAVIMSMLAFFTCILRRHMSCCYI